MKEISRRCLVLAGSLGMASLLACAADSALIPANEAQRLSGDKSVAVVSNEQLEIKVDGDAWKGYPEDLEEVATPIQVTVHNKGQEPVRVQYRDFALESVSGFRYEAQPPFRVQEEGPVQTEVVSAYGWSGFYVADYLGPFYGTAYPVWPDPIAYDPAYYQVEWRPDLPTTDMLARALPEGVLEPGGTVSGFVYFTVVPDEEERVVFSANLQPAEGEAQMAAVEIPFCTQ